ncbi:MAG: hypothetical protein D3926_05610 [Desulfobacteraceae bacterium]|nr:MAG: hypothetical protein D3926_05610 [Desulfobacteraceae bacterium]
MKIIDQGDDEPIENRSACMIMADRPKEDMMDDSKFNQEMSCSIRCEDEYQECVDRGEHESVCNVKRAQCGCSCLS